MDIRLRKTGEYITDIENLRILIRKNGTKPCLEKLTISHDMTPHTVDMYLNLAFAEAPSTDIINGSLYTVAFGNKNGIWHFDVGNINVGDSHVNMPGEPFFKKNNLKGDYAGLRSSKLPHISYSILCSAIQAVAQYPKKEPIADAFKYMAVLIIAVNEAVRFDEVMRGVNKELKNSDSTPPSYKPPANLIHNWNTHLIGG